MKAIIAGGRNYTLTKKDISFLDSLEMDEVIVGGAKGADADAKAWARSRHIRVRVFPADWEKHGRSAGPIRNGQMAAYLAKQQGDKAVILFPGGRGTANMREQAGRAVLPILDMDATEGGKT